MERSKGRRAVTEFHELTFKKNQPYYGGKSRVAEIPITHNEGVAQDPGRKTQWGYMTDRWFNPIAFPLTSSLTSIHPLGRDVEEVQEIYAEAVCIRPSWEFMESEWKKLRQDSDRELQYYRREALELWEQEGHSPEFIMAFNAFERRRDRLRARADIMGLGYCHRILASWVEIGCTGGSEPQ